MSITSRLFVPFLHFMAGGSNHIDRTYDQPVASADEDRQGSGDLFLIDGNSLAYRAFFALPESIATSDGRPTNAIYGFASMMAKVLTTSDPAAVDRRLGRRDVGPREGLRALQGAAPSRPDLLREQWPHLAPLSEAFGFSNVRVEGWEADDVIATLASAGPRAGIPVMIVSGDRDVYQLVGDGVRVMTTSRGVTDTKIYDRDGVVERYGVAAGAGPRPHRAQGRHLRQHPRRPRDRRQDRRPAAPASSARSRRCSPTSTRSPARSASRT